MENFLLLVVMYTFDNLGPDKGASGNDSLEGDHVVEVSGGESSRIAGELSESAREGTIVHCIF